MRFRNTILASLTAGALVLSGCGQVVPAAHAAEKVVLAPKPARTAKEGAGLKTAVFAGGCFWGVEAVFSHVDGVTSAVSGYHGGTKRQANYELVSGGMTDHAEAVKVTYDPRKVSYDELVRIFFSVVADPTLLNRQGPDRGTQYRTALIPMNAEQNAVAKSYLSQMGKSGKWNGSIKATIERAQAFYPAESYHQDFAHKNPNHGYIKRWDAPKVTALKRLFPQHYRAAFRTG